MLLCDRPHEKEIHFDTARFVVGKICGINIGGQRYERGDVVPEGVLSAIALREMYDTPLALIETLDFALTEPSLVEAVRSRGGLVSGMVAGGPVAESRSFVVGEKAEESKPVGQTSLSWAESILSKPETAKIDDKKEVERLRAENEALRNKKQQKGRR